MRRLALKVRSVWDGLSTTKAMILGVFLGVLLGIAPHVALGWPVMVPGFIVYLPFHAWLIFLLFSVLLSKRGRSRIMGEGYSAFGAAFGLLLTRKFGRFCLSWFFTMWLYLASGVRI